MDNLQNLKRLHSRLIEKLLEKIESGEATPTDLNVARQLLKDNDIQSLPVKNSPLFDLANLPVFDGEPDQINN